MISMEDGLVPNEEDENEVALVDGVLDGEFGGEWELGVPWEGGVDAPISQSSFMSSMKMVSCGGLMVILGF